MTSRKTPKTGRSWYKRARDAERIIKDEVELRQVRVQRQLERLRAIKEARKGGMADA